MTNTMHAALTEVVNASNAMITKLINMGFVVTGNALIDARHDDRIDMQSCLVLANGTPVAQLDMVPQDGGHALTPITAAAAKHGLYLSFEL